MTRTRFYLWLFLYAMMAASADTAFLTYVMLLVLWIPTWTWVCHIAVNHPDSWLRRQLRKL